MADREKVIQALRRCIYDPDPGQTKEDHFRDATKMVKVVIGNDTGRIS